MEKRTVGAYGRALGHVGVSVAFGKKNLPVFDHRNCGARDIFSLELVGHQAIEKSFEVGRGHLVDGRRLGWHNRCWS